MPGTTITGSVNLSLLDEKVAADLCAGIFHIDASPTVFVGGGASNVLGLRVRVTNPLGAIIKDYGVGYDVTPASASGIITPVDVPVPTKGGKYIYGIYTFSVQLTDANGTQYYVTKTQNICAYPDEATVCKEAVELVANCQGGTLTVLMAEPVTYQGKIFQNKTESWTLFYPTASGLSEVVSSFSNFQVRLFEGVYKLQGTVCVTYPMGDNIFISIGFSGKWEKNVKCVLDYSCIFPQIEKLLKSYNQDCTDDIASIAMEFLFLLKTIEITTASGEDASDQITQLEKLLGCSCTCECSVSSPVINNTPSTSISITGCNVEKSTAGLTDNYIINNLEYVVTTDPSQNIITISAPALDDCTMVQQINLNLPAMVEAFQDELTDNPAQNTFYSSLINEYLQSVNPLILGITQMQWNNMDLAAKIQAIINFAAVGGAACAGTVVASVTKSGSNAVFALSITNAFCLEIYVDGVLRGTVLAGVSSFTVSGLADGALHNYILIPRCSNAIQGTVATGTFQYIACPDIEPISVSSNNINGADCPYDLTSLVAGLPAGISAEWHTANNTSPLTLVGNPAAVNSGIYFGFAKQNASGCYSAIGVQVQVVCDSTSNCSAPQSLTAGLVDGGILVQFNGAAFPPPANSYTVKRRLYSDPDVTGSYTTVGSPGFNSTSGKWEILDTTAGVAASTVYIYRAISNCSSTSPSIDFAFIFIPCRTVTRTPSSDHVDYSFTKGFGNTKFVIHLFDSTGITELQQQTKFPGGGPGVSGTFIYLNPSTIYQTQLEVFVDTYSVLCAKQPFTTAVGDNISIQNNKGGVTVTESSVGGGSYFTIHSGAFPITNGNLVSGQFTAFTGPIQITTSGSAGATTAILYLNGVQQQCLDVSTPGAHVFASASYLPSQSIAIYISPGTC